MARCVAHTRAKHALKHGKASSVSETISEGNLGRDVSASFLDIAETLGPAAVHSFTSLTGARDDIRQYMLDQGWIHPIPHYPLTPYTIAAVDGATATEQLYAADLMAVTAVAAEGQFTATHLPTPVLSWADMRERNISNDQISRLNMLVRELSLLATIEHDYRIVDGTHLNPFIAIIQALEGRDPLPQAAVDLLAEFDVATAGLLLATPKSGVCSLAKADTETAWSDELRKTGQFPNLPVVMDKVLTAMVLEEGEMLIPRKVPSRSRTLINTNIRDNAPESVREASAHLDDALKPLQDAAVYGLLQICYFKPRTMITSLKMQFTASSDDRDDVLTEAGALAAVIGRECFGPDLQEPFPQYMADEAAKNVSVGIGLLEQTVLAQLPPETREYAVLLAYGYRS